MLSDIDIQLGINLRGIRTVERSMTQAELGAKCTDKLSPQQISKYENGEDQISAARLVDFARVFGCNILDFFKGIKTNG